MTHDYKRHGTPTLFAALDVATGEVIGQCMPRHRHQEWLKCLRRIEATAPKHLDVHLIADNDATLQAPRRARVVDAAHAPTSASWLNQVERFFGVITGDRIRCGVFKSVSELVEAINQCVDHHNADPKPFVWTASAADILDKVARGRKTLVSLH